MLTQVKLTLCVARNGTVSFLYSDSLKQITEQLGCLSVQRASNVEADARGDWHADLTPVDGPVLGPFKLRDQALRAEVKWLKKNLNL